MSYPKEVEELLQNGKISLDVMQKLLQKLILEQN